ncbi:hypothetical protein [Clostridium autoethanogenum]|uniref:HNH endonuclease n=1 Tax=Clostridium autoethanogenum DSM 10061 TaxID=1341692 RepID=A0ABN4BEV2_9CLOT|nr:hypothetical protein [Clostridium autoethanogenum]AGY75880.1 hypothetical protein CAETHG_1659 [Clostridium autoethanogenum DSM 10061]ALU36046.1 Hypothetical protein CLAU_1617 [Clostridium autoethanogenum DSM 10061]OVY51896.1 hypothetical protein WX72_00773 [Clostridium autoethanogenum]DAD54170.1 TPA_exp: protein of unknown function KV_051 [Clostridium autoethanogenum DSM 10061]
MSKEKVFGTCALCQKENVELMQSHIIPKAVYKRAKTFENSRFRSFYEPKKIFQDGEKKPMLCHDCEEFFSKYETKFVNQFLDKYLKNPFDNLPEVSKDTDFYALTVAWRILYDDLYVQHSYQDDSERAYLGEYEHKLRRFLYERYLDENPEESVAKPTFEMPDLKGKCFGEIIAEIEKYEKSKLPENISEVKNYMYTLSELGFSDVVKLFDFMIWGYSFYTPTRTKYYIISGYKDLVIATVYHRKRNILITGDWKLLRKAGSSETVVKKDLIDEMNVLIDQIRKRYPEVQKKLDENGLREKISKRYENQKKQDYEEP